jgi:predicted nucleic-acid-binding protein
MLKEKKKKTAWIDTETIIYYFRENAEHSPKVQALIEAASRGEYTLKVSPVVLSECVFILRGRHFGATKEAIKTALISFINMKGIEMEEQKVIEEALINYVKKDMDFTDAYLTAHGKHTYLHMSY